MLHPEAVYHHLIECLEVAISILATSKLLHEILELIHHLRKVFKGRWGA
jgi:hypothetical protein